MKTRVRAHSGARIHPSAIVGAEVELASDVEVGPFCLLEGRIRIGAGTRLIARVTVMGDSEIGEGNVLHPNVVIGDEPQDVTYRGGRRAVRIGNRNVIREGATVHRGSEKGEVTIIGDDNLLMVNSHVGHDCRVGNGVTLVNGALLGGWAQIGDGAVISGNCAVHQFCRVGRLALMSGGSRTSMDLPPFCVLDLKNLLRGINVVGLKRAGMGMAQIRALRNAYTVLFGRRRNLRLAMDELLSTGPASDEVLELVEFIRSSRRGVAFSGGRYGEEAEPE